MRTYGGRFPFVLARDAYTAVFRRAGYGHDVELMLQLLERLVLEQGLAGSLGITVEEVHLLGSIAFGQDGHIDAVFGASALVHVAVRSDALQATFVDEYVVRTDFVRKGSHCLVVHILQGYGNHSRLLGERQEERVLETFLYAGGFFFAHPFLEEAGERGAVDYLSAGLVGHGYLAVACQGKFAEVVASACPVRKATQFVEVNLLFLCVSCKNIIRTEGFVFEEIMEILCLQGCT